MTTRLSFLAATGAGALTTLVAAPASAESGGGTLVALYKKPADTAAFDAYYRDHHAPLAKTLPNLQSYTVGYGGPKDPYYYVAILTFPTAAAMQDALASATGQKVVGDLKNFAQAGVDVIAFPSTAV